MLVAVRVRFRSVRIGLSNPLIVDPQSTAELRRFGSLDGNASVIQGFYNPILTVMWLVFFHINASNG